MSQHCIGNPVVKEEGLPLNINLDKPRYDQSFYINRARHFFGLTNPMNIFASEEALINAKCLVTKYKRGDTLPSSVTEDSLWQAKTLYDSAYHPDTGEKMFILGRMSAQVPCNMVITGAMLTFYKTTTAVVFWQWMNQSFNALVNYTNRGGDAKLSTVQLGSSYVFATGGALATALTLNNMVKKMSPLIGRFVPFTAVCAANCINIPMMRIQELQEGVPIQDEYGHRLGCSTVAARSGIVQVVFSRLLMATPGMVAVPLFMNFMEKRGTWCRYPWAVAPVQISLVGLVLTFATPLCCALFKQQASIGVTSLEPDVQRHIKLHSRSGCTVDVVYYNKGL